MGDLVKQLKETSLGETLSASEAADIVQSAKKRDVARGSFLFRAGEKGNALFVILEGSLDVVLGTPENGTVVASLGPGQIVGEMEIMTGSLRMASLLATIDTQALELSGATFEAMVKENRPAATKLVYTISKTLARRLAMVNQRLTSKGPSTPSPAPAPAAAAKPAAPAAKNEIVEVSADDVVVEDADLDVLDKLWG
jgi:CRP-like cAMP-binding protein